MGFGFVVAFDAFRIGVLIIPDMLGGLPLGEKEQVGFDAGVGVEYAVWAIAQWCGGCIPSATVP